LISLSLQVVFGKYSDSDKGAILVSIFVVSSATRILSSSEDELDSPLSGDLGQMFTGLLSLLSCRLKDFSKILIHTLSLPKHFFFVH